MHAGKLVFAQVMEFAPWHTFRRLVVKYRGDFNVRTFSCLDHFLCMAFAQVELALERASRRYPERLRRIRYNDLQSDQTYVFLTNHFGIPALSVCALFKSRWEIELFFKWIKQHLRIKRFFGTSENAVKTQVWIAVATYVLVAIIRKRLNVQRSLYSMLQILSVNPFQTTPLDQLFTEAAPSQEMPDDDKQLILF